MGEVDEDVKNQLKELEELLEEGDKRIRDMVNSMPNALVYFLDRHGSVLFMNKALESAVGGELSKKTYSALTNADEQQVAKILKIVQSVVETNQPVVVESEKFVAHNGFTRTVRTQMTPLEYNGQLACMVFSLISDSDNSQADPVAQKHGFVSEPGDAGEGDRKKSRAEDVPDSPPSADDRPEGTDQVDAP